MTGPLTVHLQAADGATSTITIPQPVIGYSQPAVDSTHIAMAGTDLRTAVHGSSGSALLIPAGTFSLAGFSDPQGYVDGARINKLSHGLSGAGPGKTIITPVVNSGTYVPPTSDTNNAFVIQDSKDGISNAPTIPVYEGFTVQGSAQSTTKFYNGFRVAFTTGAIIRYVSCVDAGPGNDHEPPGETFQMATNQTVNTLIQNCTITASGGHGASPIGGNNDTNLTWDTITCQTTDGTAMASMPTCWQVNGLTIKNLVSRNGYAGLNLEDVSGAVLITNPVLYPDRTLFPYRYHFQINNQQSDNPNIVIKWDGVPTVGSGFPGVGQCVTVLIQDQYGAGQKQTSMPKLYSGGQLMTMVDYPTTGYTGPALDPTKFWFRGHQ